MKLIDIAEVARRSGVPASALRFYEEKGLIESLGRRGLRRTFDANVVEQLSLIALGRMAGFSLDEIGGVFGAKRGPALDKAVLADKAEALDRTIRQLAALKRGLEHAAACPAPNHAECPKFRRLLKVAVARAGRARAKRRS
jgi:DNA-binding transcriptional MerR regulator